MGNTSFILRRNDSGRCDSASPSSQSIYSVCHLFLLQVVTGAVRQLQHLVCDDPPAQCTSMFLAEAKRGGAGGPVASAHRRLAAEQAYQKRSERLLQDENCFKVYTVSSINDGDPLK